MTVSVFHSDGKKWMYLLTCGRRLAGSPGLSTVRSFSAWSRNISLHNMLCLLSQGLYPTHFCLPGWFNFIFSKTSPNKDKMSGTVKRLWLVIRWIVFRLDNIITETVNWTSKKQLPTHLSGFPSSSLRFSAELQYSSLTYWRSSVTNKITTTHINQ